ncbi:hypothetical protein [Amorphus orientalis]|uniref:Uncharacterized protein n=1 Tax=Amorphus orientalis TaxID=649198 RepID=A0AAE3VTH9_9HYPH|nr:hypothetical protein [Amorphus orientalis]MDQ0317316.1 hypothetical protein [Amorphus orientalis]
MTRPTLRFASAGLLAAMLAIGSASPAAAFGDLLARLFGPPPLSIQQMHALTPSCRTHSGPWEGRVSGDSEGTYNDAARVVSLVGCFPSLEACSLWRLRMSGSMQGRLIYDQCTRR